MQDPKFYPDPLEFNGFRFVDEERLAKISSGASLGHSQQKPSKLTDVDMTFHVWGTGRMACPGRHYAAAVMKVIMGQVILNYNCNLVDQHARRYLYWRSTILPKPNTLIEFTPILTADGP